MRWNGSLSQNDPTSTISRVANSSGLRDLGTTAACHGPECGVARPSSESLGPRASVFNTAQLTSSGFVKMGTWMSGRQKSRIGCRRPSLSFSYKRTTMQNGQEIEVWCVHHRDGWCATAPNRKHGDVDYAKTKCGHVVTLPWGFERRVPDCCECSAVGQSPQSNLQEKLAGSTEGKK